LPVVGIRRVAFCAFSDCVKAAFYANQQPGVYHSAKAFANMESAVVVVVATKLIVCLFRCEPSSYGFCPLYNLRLLGCHGLILKRNIFASRRANCGRRRDGLKIGLAGLVGEDRVFL